MIFRRHRGLPFPHHGSKAVIRRLPFVALMGILCLPLAQPTRAEEGTRQIDLGRYVLTSMDGGRWLVTDRQTGETRIVREQWANTMGSNRGGDHDRARAGDRSNILGRVWRENESGWNGLWRRRGDSNIFDAEWTGPGRVTGTLDIQFDGPDRVTIERIRSSNGDSCRYTGQISGGGRVSGTYRCGNSNLMPWSATIER